MKYFFKKQQVKKQGKEKSSTLPGALRHSKPFASYLNGNTTITTGVTNADKMKSYQWAIAVLKKPHTDIVADATNALDGKLDIVIAVDLNVAGENPHGYR